MSIANLISLDIPEEDIQEIDAAFEVIRTKLEPHIKVVYPPDANRLPKLGDRNVAFVEKAIDLMKNNPAMVPDFLSVEEAEVDLNGYKTLRPYLQKTQAIYTELNSSSILSGSEAYNAALVYYNYVKALARGKVPAAKAIYDELKGQFKK